MRRCPGTRVDATRLAAVLAAAIALSAPAPAPAVELAGRSGNVAWEIVDVVQTRLVDEQATRWDFVVTLKLVSGGAIVLERIEVGASGGAQSRRPANLRLRPGEAARIFHSERTAAGESRRHVLRRYLGHDERGTAVAVEVRALFDATVGARAPAPVLASVSAPRTEAALPPDLRVIRPAVGAPPRWAGFSGVWTGTWPGGRSHVLIVEEVGPESAIVVYGLGAAGGRQPTWFRRKARIADDRLIVEIASDERIAYTRRADGGLSGAWAHDDGRTGRVALARQVAAARPSADATPARAARLNSEALAALLDGQLADALPRATESVALRESALGPSHPDVAISLTTLAEVYRAQGRLDDAERLHRRALAIREASRGRDHPDVAGSLNHLAVLHNARATYREAEALLTRALSIVEKSKAASGAGQANRVKAEILGNLARVYRAQGRVVEAEEAQARASLLWASQ